MATFDLPEWPEPRAPRQLMLGAVSPLWAYFGAAAAGGVAYWWMTRWTRPVNIEALFGGIAQPAPAPSIEAVAELVTEAVEAGADVAETVVAATADAVIEASEAMTDVASEAEAIAEALPDATVGGEAASIAPLSAVLAAPESEPPEPVVEAAPEPALEIAPEPVVEAAPAPEAVVEAAPEPEAVVDAAPEPEAGSPPPPEPEAPPMVEATTDPLPAPVAKPRARKTPPGKGLKG